tara:strand:+ start:276 stop:695 length:420 start_codon:yes stop_codon:yes gene_type:complete
MAKNKKIFEEISESRKLRQNDRRKLDSIVGNLYTFKYASATANISNPVILVVYRTKGGRLFTAKDRKGNSNTYMAGIVLNDLATGTRKLIIEKLMSKKRISYSMIKRAGVTFKAKYRVYNYTKAQNLSLIDSGIYLETL